LRDKDFHIVIGLQRPVHVFRERKHGIVPLYAKEYFRFPERFDATKPEALQEFPSHIA